MALNQQSIYDKVSGKTFTRDLSNPNSIYAEAPAGTMTPSTPASSSPSATSPAKSAYIGSLAGTDKYANYSSAFGDYLKTLAPSAELVSARKGLADLQSNIVGKQLAARRQYESTLYQQGGTVAGAQAAAALGSRRSNSELADLAVQENAAANTVSALSGAESNQGDIAKARLDFEKFLIGEEDNQTSPEGFNLSEGQSRYEYNPQTGQYEQIAAKGKTYAPGTGSSSRIIGSTDSGYFTLNDDGTVSPLQLKPTVSWDQYIKAAGDSMGMDINPGSDIYKKLQEQYNTTYLKTAVGGSGNDWGL